MERPTETVVQTARSAAEKLTGWKRRQFEAEVACTYCDGNPRRTESWFGWGRETVARGLDDHDMHPSTILTPAGILEVDSNQLNIVFGQSRDTSDFVADALDTWWADRRVHYSHVKTLLINLDNGPEVSRSRTQFMKRLVEFSDQHQLMLQLAYYPPYHSKYNPIERCWGILENHWNGTLLTSVETALSWARTMTWRGIHPVVHFTQQVYETGVRIAKHAWQRARSPSPKVRAEWELRR